MRVFLPLILIIVSILSCNRSSNNKKASSLALLPETCATGCSIYGLNQSKKVNCVEPSASKETSLSLTSGAQFEGVILSTKSLKGDTLTISPSTKISKVYAVTSCPLDTDSLTASKEDVEYKTSEQSTGLKLEIKRANTYALVISTPTNPGTLKITYTTTSSTSTATSATSTSLKGNCVKNTSDKLVVCMDQYSSTTCPTSDFKSLKDSVSSSFTSLITSGLPCSSWQSTLSSAGITSISASKFKGSCKVPTGGTATNVGIWLYYDAWAVGDADATKDPQKNCTGMGGSWATTVQTF